MKPEEQRATLFTRKVNEPTEPSYVGKVVLFCSVLFFGIFLSEPCLLAKVVLWDAICRTDKVVLVEYVSVLCSLGRDISAWLACAQSKLNPHHDLEKGEKEDAR